MVVGFLAAPEGCLQYYTGLTGTISSFNYAGGMHLAEQNYQVCVRTELGMCEIRWAIADTDSFQLDGTVGHPAANSLGDDCSRDYVFTLNTFGARLNQNANRYCGGDLIRHMANPQPGTVRSEWFVSSSARGG